MKLKRPFKYAVISALLNISGMVITFYLFAITLTKGEAHSEITRTIGRYLFAAFFSPAYLIGESWIYYNPLIWAIIAFLLGLIFQRFPLTRRNT